MILIALAICAGLWVGKPVPAGKPLIALVKNGEKEFPLAEHKSFVVVLYAQNQALWCERALRSIFEQDYDHYRVIVIDDGSTDGTADLAKRFVLDNNQAEKVILIHNETTLGQPASLYRAIDGCLDREIIVSLDAKDWFLSPGVLARLNKIYQNPDVWLTMAESLDYPSYEANPNGPISYYAALFKQIHLQDLFKGGHFASHPDAYLGPLMGLSSGHIYKLQEPLLFSNSAAATSPPAAPDEVAEYKPLAAFPKPKVRELADLLIFSNDRPLQLYACLESIQRYMTGFEQLTILYSASNPTFAASYEKVKEAFPVARFVQDGGDFKFTTQQIVFESPSKYILFGVDDIIVKDFVDLRSCMDLMEKTAAYGFYLRLGNHLYHNVESPASEELSAGIFAWDLAAGESDWGFANSLDMTLFKKEQLKEPLAKLKYKTANDLQSTWALCAPKTAIGLYFERSKSVNVPSHSSLEELLLKFNQGLKIDIEPLYKTENRSPRIEYAPELVPR